MDSARSKPPFIISLVLHNRQKNFAFQSYSGQGGDFFELLV